MATHEITGKELDVCIPEEGAWGELLGVGPVLVLIPSNPNGRIRAFESHNVDSGELVTAIVDEGK